MVDEIVLQSRLDAADAEVARRADQVAAGGWRLRYHFMPPVGAMNDPNGFVEFRREIHLFFQFQPYFPELGAQHWGHAVSSDLLRWRILPTALAPSEGYDRDGCFSGSAIVDDDGRLVLMYSGYVTDLWPGSTQNIAVSDDGIRFYKSPGNPVIPSPPAVDRQDLRDPKFLEVDGVTFAVVGSSSDGKGRILLYRAAAGNLDEWTLVGVAAESSGPEGTMWECPDLFPLGDRFALITSPMNGTVDAVPVVEVGTFNADTGRFAAESRHVLDAGDLYAPQTMRDSSGRRILIGWMRQWNHLPVTAEEGWIGAMTIPRELVLAEGRVRQRPVKELESLRGTAQGFGPVMVGRAGFWVDAGTAAEVRVVLAADSGRRCRVGVRAATDRSEQTCYLVDRDAGRVISDRSLSGEGEVTGAVSEFADPPGDLELRFFLDTCSVELFIDDGAAVLTHCVYPDPSSRGFFIEPIGDGEVEILDLTIWPLEMQ